MIFLNGVATAWINYTLKGHFVRKHGKPHKVFENKLNRDFTAGRANRKWCTDFTYLFLAIRTLQKALDSQPQLKGALILHSDQGSQYTSKAFVEYCESVHVTQSMRKAGYPYDNAPVEEFAYVGYNHVRPHSFNGYRTPHQARMAS